VLKGRRGDGTSGVGGGGSGERIIAFPVGEVGDDEGPWKSCVF
jgi:hypothetical protein